MARRIGALKTFPALWQDHEQLYVSVFSEALKRLNIEDAKNKKENAISEVLSLVLREVCSERNVRTPEWEKPIQPVTKEELKGGTGMKIPDFTCTHHNSFPNNFDMFEISLHTECKRLGQKSGSWDLNKNYVNNGIRRFDSSDHKYGSRAKSGIMIGYITNMEPNSILEIVNKYLPDQLEKLSFALTKKVVSCEQDLIREKVKPEEFKLIHIWADLKN